MNDQKIIKMINGAAESVWLIRQQYFRKAMDNIKELLADFEDIYPELCDYAETSVVDRIGLPILIEAQENFDEILIADVLENQWIPTLEEIVQCFQLENPQEKTDYFERNMRFLSSKRVENIDSIYHASKNDTCEYDVEYTASGQKTIKLVEKGTSYYLSGNNNPYRDALAFYSGNIIPDKYKYVIFGVELFYAAEVMLKYRSDMELVVVEEDPYILRIALESRDLTHLLRDERLTIVCSKYMDYVQRIDEENEVLLVRKPAIRHMQSETEQEIMERFFVKTMTIYENKGILEKNFRENIEKGKEIKSVECCSSQLCNQKVYLVGGGPSLDESIHILKNKSDDEKILCVGTAARKLVYEGIQPDFVIISDGVDKISDQIRDGLDNNDTKLIYLCSANYKAVNSFDGDKYAVFQKGFPLAEEYAKKHDFAIYNTGGSVITTALDVCIASKVKSIICLGVDLAYTGDNTHATGTYQKQKVSEASNWKYESGIGGNPIKTSPNLSSYKRWIERRIENEKRIEFVNISNGAYICGMNNVLVDDYLE